MKIKQSLSECCSGIAVVILAAGESKRYGSPKQLADWNGDPLLLTVIKQVESCGCLPYLALGAHKDLIYQNDLLASYRDQVIEVENWHSGISASIITSAQFLLSNSAIGVLFILGDQPLIGAKHIRKMLNLAEKSPEQTFCTAYKQDRSEYGVPAYFPCASFAKLLSLKADQGAKWLLRSEQPQVIPIESSMPLESSLLDIDEPEDLIRAKTILSGNQ